MVKRLAQTVWLVEAVLIGLAVNVYNQSGFQGGGPLMGMIAIPIFLGAFVLFGPPWRAFTDD